MNKIIRPQKGQEEFLASPVDVCIFGGQAGCGKSYALLLEPIRFVDKPNFSATAFRRTLPQIRNSGGLWDTAIDLYRPFGPKISMNPDMCITFKSGSKVVFKGLQYEETVKEFDGSQIPLLLFDELQHFTEYQFFYMLSRNRSGCNVNSYVRATCNPDPDSFLREFLSWWIDQETGYPILDRSGKIRHFIRIDNKLITGTKEELLDKYRGCFPKSFSFIPGNVFENKELLKNDPGYIANLEALPSYEKDRLLGGNWFARPSKGDLFDIRNFQYIDIEDLPKLITSCRSWDRAATKPNDTNRDPDYTVGARIGIDKSGNIYIIDIARKRDEPGAVNDLIEMHYIMDDERIILEQEPGASGKSDIDFLVNHRFVDYDTGVYKKTSNRGKLSCWKPLSSRLYKKKVYLVRGNWNRDFLLECENVTDGTQKGHDDQVDAVANGYNWLMNNDTGFFADIVNV